jgi:hypothetical protein
MKKLVVLTLAALAISSMAYGVADPDVNSMGIYFDLNADVFETVAPVYVATPVYVILTNPDFDAVYGFEFGYTVEGLGGSLFSGITFAGTGPIDVGGVAGNHIVGLGAPMPTSPATLLATLTYIFLSSDTMSWTLTGSTPNSTVGSVTPNVLLANDFILPCGLSAGLVDGAPQVCAINNGGGVVAVEEASWEGVKSLYR